MHQFLMKLILYCFGVFQWVFKVCSECLLENFLYREKTFENRSEDILFVFQFAAYPAYQYFHDSRLLFYRPNSKFYQLLPFFMLKLWMIFGVDRSYRFSDTFLLLCIIPFILRSGLWQWNTKILLYSFKGIFASLISWQKFQN